MESLRPRVRAARGSGLGACEGLQTRALEAYGGDLSAVLRSHIPTGLTQAPEDEHPDLGSLSG